MMEGINRSLLTLKAMHQYQKLNLSVLIMAIILMVIGPLIQFRHGVSLACPEWPLCFAPEGQRFAAQAWIEMSHRILATLVGMGSFALVIGAYRYPEFKNNIKLKKASAYAFMFVLIQGILGALTVFYRLPMAISTLHMLFSLVFLFYQLKLIILTSESVPSENPKPIQSNLAWSASLRDVLWICSTLLFGLIILGSFVRHTSSLTVCGTGWESLFTCQSILGGEINPRINLHLLFRAYAFVTTLSCVLGFIFFIRHFRTAKISFFDQLFRPYIVWIYLIITQFFIGMMVLVNHVSMFMSILYLIFNLFAITCSWYLALRYSSQSKLVHPDRRHSLVSDLYELTKPRLTGLVMVTAMVGMILAPLPYSLFTAIVVLVLICMVVMGACALNCYIEREVDKKMIRTKDRSLPAGRLSARIALIFSCILLGVSLPLLAWASNILTAVLAVVAAVLYLWAYTPMKRQSELALFVGAVPGALPPVMGWTAVTNSLDPMAVVLFLFMFIWQLPHFMAISIFHANDYKEAGIQVYPNRLGFNFTKNSIFIYTAMLFITTLLPFWLHEAGFAYAFIAGVFSLAFLALAAQGYFLKNDLEVRRIWAKRYFLASVFYLPLIMGSMIVFK
jgi:heme o synthase